MGAKTILTLIIVVIIVAVLVIYFTIRGLLSTYSQNTPAQQTTQQVVKNTIDVAQIIDDPLVFDGLTVEVEAQITDWVTKKSFTIQVPSQGGIFGGGVRQLLVIASKDFPLPKNTTKEGVGVGELVNIHLKGVVRIMDRLELGQALGLDLDGTEITLDDNNIDKWEEGSIILVESVKKI